MFTPPVLLTAEQTSKNEVRATWEPYEAPDAEVIIFGSIQGFASEGSAKHVVGAFLYAQDLAAGEVTVPLDHHTAQGANVTVTLFVQASGQPSVESNAVEFTFSKSGK